MILLSDATEVLEILTTTTADIDYVISYKELPSLTNFSAQGKINTAVSTFILPEPTDGFKRQVNLIVIRNIHASTSNNITVKKQITGNTYSLTPTVTLLAGESYVYVESVGWIYYASDGSVKGTLTGLGAGGDLSGSYPNPTVQKILNNQVPANSLGYLYNDGSGILSWTNPIVKCIYTQKAYKTIASSVVETSILNSTYTFPANFFTAGQLIRIKFTGFHSAVATPTIRIKVKLGSVIILDTGAVNSGNSTNAFAEINGVITCYSTGALGTVSGQGLYQELGGGTNQFPMTNTSLITLDTTVAQILDITAQWGTSSASNTITISDGYIDVFKP